MSVASFSFQHCYSCWVCWFCFFFSSISVNRSKAWLWEYWHAWILGGLWCSGAVWGFDLLDAEFIQFPPRCCCSSGTLWVMNAQIWGPRMALNHQELKISLIQSRKEIKRSLGVSGGMFATGLVVFPCHPGLFKKLVVTVTFPDNSFAGEWGCNVIFLPSWNKIQHFKQKVLLLSFI